VCPAHHHTVSRKAIQLLTLPLDYPPDESAGGAGTVCLIWRGYRKPHAWDQDVWPYDAVDPCRACLAPEMVVLPHPYQTTLGLVAKAESTTSPLPGFRASRTRRWLATLSFYTNRSVILGSGRMSLG
jgi:hypothetical protein